MLKHEFEQMTTGGNLISDDLFKEIDRDYMNTYETKKQYVERVFGISATKTAEDVERTFRHEQQQQREKAEKAMLEDVLKIQRLVLGAREDLANQKTESVFCAFNMMMEAIEQLLPLTHDVAL